MGITRIPNEILVEIFILCTPKPHFDLGLQQYAFDSHPRKILAILRGVSPKWRHLVDGLPLLSSGKRAMAPNFSVALHKLANFYGNSAANFPDVGRQYTYTGRILTAIQIFTFRHPNTLVIFGSWFWRSLRACLGLMRSDPQWLRFS
ncbi:hypothetical protein M422DRAFT_250487 [Sphaerobolus stellatus SS14]|uniref:F-box domain-containing protein n=1 Tax=Sphaerobolus stellatus (strain SS14) TaxID=990650 RepID=A0A0C9VTW4_SPHS4|nr:hypothetical protein M422DRAFT_250487 [Sphaerobolus stellatus SS14]